MWLLYVLYYQLWQDVVRFKELLFNLFLQSFSVFILLKLLFEQIKKLLFVLSSSLFAILGEEYQKLADLCID